MKIAANDFIHHTNYYSNSLIWTRIVLGQDERLNLNMWML